MSDVRQEHPPVACNLTAEEQTERHADVTERIFARVLETEDLTDGYGFRFPADGTLIQELIEFIQFERGCCPFFTFELVFEPSQGPVTLRMRGPEGTKEFLQQHLNDDC